MENKPRIIIPTEVVDEAIQKDDPKAVFDQVKVQEIILFMNTPFLSKDNGNPNPRNPNLLIERFNA